MALDAALMESVRGGSPPAVRFYRWSPPCLSLGRNQPARDAYDADAIRARGLDVVRRPTGGRAVLHDRELTYSVVVEDGLLGSPRQSYATINRALVAGLRRLGVPAALQPRTGGRAPVPSLVPCFKEPVEGEVVAAGGKLLGSAQYRERGVVLQHGSLLLEGDQRDVRALLRGPGAPGGDLPPVTLATFCDPLPEWHTITHALADGWVEVVGGQLVADEPSGTECARSVELAEVRFGDPAWTWHR
jgi:lipoate-protein ligase A